MSFTPKSEISARHDVPATSELPENSVDRPTEAEDWQDSIELPDDTSGWVDSIELSDVSSKWQDSIRLYGAVTPKEQHQESIQDLVQRAPEIVHPVTDGSTLEQTDFQSEASENGDTEKREYPYAKTIDGERHYYDSQGNLYRIGNQLLPDTTYEINGYKYKTDEFGRIVSAVGKLHLKDENRKHLTIRDSIEDIGKGDQKDSDDRGHLIGDQFDGSNGLENLVPQDANINRVDFKKFENELAKEVKSGSDVYVKVEPIYDGDSNRPTNIVVSYSINRKEDVRIFPND